MIKVEIIGFILKSQIVAKLQCTNTYEHEVEISRIIKISRRKIMILTCVQDQHTYPWEDVPKS